MSDTTAAVVDAIATAPHKTESSCSERGQRISKGIDRLSNQHRAVIFIGEGNDGGSKLRYAELRNLAESNRIAFFAALVANHSLRGTKSILRYGWNLRELTSDTAGIFFENQNTSKASWQLSESIRSLRLVTFEIPYPQSGRYKLSVSSKPHKRFKAQKGIVIP